MGEADQLLKMAAEGDSEAFCRLIAVHEKWLFQRAYAMAHNFHLAEDLTQETLLEAWKSIRRYDGTCRFTTWLYSILMHRYKKSRRHAGPAGLRPGLAAPAAEMDTLADPSAARALASVPLNEEAARVRAAIDQLPDAMRDVTSLRFFAHATLDEIARILVIPEGTVKSRLHYALEKLRELAGSR